MNTKPTTSPIDEQVGKMAQKRARERDKRKPVAQNVVERTWTRKPGGYARLNVVMVLEIVGT